MKLPQLRAAPLIGLLLLAVSGFAQQVGPVSITSAQCAQISVGQQTSTVGIQVTGTWTGTLQPQVALQGQAAANTQVTPSTSSTPQSTITANGVFTASVAGNSTFLLCGATVATGTAVVYLNGSTAAVKVGGGSGSGTVTSFSAGTLSPIFTTSVATATTTPALSFSLTNAGGGTVFGRSAGTSGAPAYTTTPVLGIAGTSTGTLGLTGATSGTATITPQATAGTPTLTLPNASGTFAVTASAPVVLSATTGNLTCPTCGAIVQAFCAGVVGTANATEYELTPTNNAVNTACTTPLGATNESMPMPMACTMSNLWVNARAGGATAGSGVIKVYKNSVATAITCTLGTGTDKQCSDTTHTAAFAAGDTYKITVLTNQATDTTNGVRVALVCN